MNSTKYCIIIGHVMAEKKVNYRRIYESYHGPIPKEADGRTYEIHHRDGNHENLSPDNLVAVTLKEHYNIHYSQGDYGACFYMANRMKLSASEKSELARQAALKRVENGTHNLSGENNPTHRRVVDGTHNFFKLNDTRLSEGTHNFLIKTTCPHCGKHGQKAGMTQFHFDKCKHREKDIT